MMISFTVKGIPRPQARPRSYIMRKTGGYPWDKKRGFLSAFGRRVIGTYSPKTDWFQCIYAEALQNRPKTPLEGPIYLKLIYIMPRPKGIKKGTIWHIKRPDMDNLEKAVMDACTNAEIWHDDGQVCKKYTEKKYGDDPGLSINIREIKTRGGSDARAE